VTELSLPPSGRTTRIPTLTLTRIIPNPTLTPNPNPDPDPDASRGQHCATTQKSRIVRSIVSLNVGIREIAHAAVSLTPADFTSTRV
jgi:hypothetical protein